MVVSANDEHKRRGPAERFRTQHPTEGRLVQEWRAAQVGLSCSLERDDRNTSSETRSSSETFRNSTPRVLSLVHLTAARRTSTGGSFQGRFITRVSFWPG